jgi:hypothetical protein
LRRSAEQAPGMTGSSFEHTMPEQAHR